MTIWERIAAALTGLAVPMGAGVYIAATLPDLYLVYFLVSAPPLQHGDNAERERMYRVQVTIYSRAGLGNQPAVDTAMVAAGFMRGPERELPYNTSTRHYGLAKEFIYLDQE